MECHEDRRWGEHFEGAAIAVEGGNAFQWGIDPEAVGEGFHGFALLVNREERDLLPQQIPQGRF
jgi:hypothetical protein